MVFIDMYFKQTNIVFDRDCYYQAVGTGLNCDGIKCYIGCTDFFGCVNITWFVTVIENIVCVDDIPEDVKERFWEYIRNPFFEIDLRRYIEEKHITNVRLYED